MQDFSESLKLAFQLLVELDPDLMEIIGLSLRVSITATLFSCVLGLLIGASLAISNFTGRSVVITLINAMMGLPPVVVGLIVYPNLSRAGPFGWLGLLYTPTAMIIAQTLLITPIIAALSRQVIEETFLEYREQFDSLVLGTWQRIKALLWDCRYALLTVALAGFGRSIAEVGAVIIVGGNIEHYTRVMTTAIALETSRGNLAMALALGVILMTLALIVNASVSAMRLTASRFGYA